MFYINRSVQSIIYHSQSQPPHTECSLSIDLFVCAPCPHGEAITDCLLSLFLYQRFYNGFTVQRFETCLNVLHKAHCSKYNYTNPNPTPLTAKRCHIQTAHSALICLCELHVLMWKLSQIDYGWHKSQFNEQSEGLIL